jgi:tRNA threonylcarbamoyladenosine biosynthesis protein TsaE
LPLTLRNGLVKLNKRVKSLEETAHLARSFAKELSPGAVIAFFGELGSGKTTFIRTLAGELCHIPLSTVNSPTFQYLNIYEGNERQLFHFDLYRLKGVDDFLSLGFEEMLSSNGVCCIEWAERIIDILPDETITVSLTHVSETERLIEVKNLR